MRIARTCLGPLIAVLAISGCEDGGAGDPAGNSAGAAGGTGGASGSAQGGVSGSTSGGFGGSTSGATSGGSAGNFSGGSGGAAGNTAGGSSGATSGGAAGNPTGGSSGSAGSPAIPECCPEGTRITGTRCLPVGMVCGTAFCEERPHAKTECGANACNYVCRDGYGDCDGNASNGCETKLVDPKHCGSCTTACGTGQLCSETAGCVSACQAPEAECDGACLNVNTSPLACNGCGPACSAPDHGYAICTLDGCDFACDAGFTKCGVSCVDTQADANSCGACGKTCSAPLGGIAWCDTGNCQSTCPPGYTDCNSMCRDTRTDDQACGGCDQPCSGVCVAGVCETSFDPVVVAGAVGDGLKYYHGNLFWLDGGDIMMAPSVSGSSSVTLAASQGSVGEVNPRGSFVYYPTTDSIWRVPMAGGVRELVATPTAAPSLLSTSTSAVFWAEGGAAIYTAPLSGGSRSTFYTSASGTIVALESSPDGTTLYAGTTTNALLKIDATNG
ncbi:MAG: hypothetical protein AB7K71_19925, partial [Polyangiaceae bacterium]